MWWSLTLNLRRGIISVILLSWLSKITSETLTNSNLFMGDLCYQVVIRQGEIRTRPILLVWTLLPDPTKLRKILCLAMVCCCYGTAVFVEQFCCVLTLRFTARVTWTVSWPSQTSVLSVCVHSLERGEGWNGSLFSPTCALTHTEGDKADTCKTHAQTKLFFIDSLGDLLLSEGPWSETSP